MNELKQRCSTCKHWKKLHHRSGKCLIRSGTIEKEDGSLRIIAPVTMGKDYCNYWSSKISITNFNLENKKVKILHNRAKCALCQDVIESFSRHDWVSCKCGEIFVDGGTLYQHSGAINSKNLIDLSEFEEETICDNCDPIDSPACNKCIGP